MTHDEAFAYAAKAIATVAPEVDLATVPGGARLRDELDLDSIDFLGVVQAVCDLTGVDIPEADYATVGTLDGLVAYIAERTS